MTTQISPITTDKANKSTLLPLEWWQVRQLTLQGCTADNWDDLLVAPGTELSLIKNVRFKGDNEIGLLDSTKYPDCGISNATLQDCRLAEGVSIHNISGALVNCKIGPQAVIDNVDRIVYEPEAACGVGTLVNVLDETGSRPVMIYPGISAQSAALMARMPRESESDFIPQTESLLEEKRFSLSGIGERAVIRDCGPITNVYVDREVRVEGAAMLKNGAIINNAMPGRPLAFVGYGVNAENFIVEDGVVDTNVVLRNCYVGQGASLEKAYTAHDSLFFANCSLENGEACALFAGPYTVSMHKGTLLIGCQTSFMNAGSSTNQSNHMYKLGPVHWGVLERGVKTSSNSYLMLGALIGAFSLLMGQHKTHPDSSEFPFSYLFGDPQGATVVVPAMMLKSCGLLRDEKKWPTRDRRLKRKLPLHDRINFEVLNPCTIARIITALETIANLLQRPADDDRYIRYKGMKISRASLERAKKLYTLAIYKYLYGKLADKELPPLTVEQAEQLREEWVDLAGQLMPRSCLTEAIEAESVEAREAIFDRMFDDYEDIELKWIAAYIPHKYLADKHIIATGAVEFDHIVEEDRTSYREQLDAEQQMLRL